MLPFKKLRIAQHQELLLIIHTKKGTVSKKVKRKTPIYFNTKYRTELKLVPIIMDYCLLQFDALKFFLRVCLHAGVNLTLIFSM